jgi:anti-sigma factor RsiW
MKHEEIKLKLLALYDGPLSEQERLLVEGHLPTCPDCRRAVEESRKISGVLFPEPSFSEASEDLFVSRVMARLAPGLSPQATAAFPPANLLRWLLVGSAVAAAWVFFSVLPQTPGLGTDTAAENLFSENEVSVSSPDWGVIPASNTDNVVVALIR